MMVSSRAALPEDSEIELGSAVEDRTGARQLAALHHVEEDVARARTVGEAPLVITEQVLGAP